ncbi:TPM domain-containing protein [Peptacetobacter sp.]|uniref:TPM domain-containing protein n=1 Tax=Peptacetobacter sp. TaxID=2991975 RepID=UPI003AB15A9B
MKSLEKNNFKKISLSIFIAFSMIFCSVFLNLKTIEKSFADGDMEYTVDSAKVLTTEELESLKSKLAQISDENNIDVGVVTVDYLDGKSAQEFANDLFEQNKFGKGENRDGILLLVATEDREWAMSTHGSAKEAFNEEGLDYLSGEFLPYLSDDDFYSAFENFADNAQELGTMYVAGDPYGEGEYVDDENYPVDENIVEEEKGINNEVWIPLSIVMGCAISLIIMMMYKSQLKSVKSESRADDYLMDMKLVKSQDIFLYRTVTRTMRPKNTDTGGSSSGGGSSYGGSSGSF